MIRLQFSSDGKTFVFNGMKFTPVEGGFYLHDYYSILKKVANDQDMLINAIRTLIARDLFFVVYFVVKNPLANHKWIIDRCNEVQQNTDKKQVYIWSRGHLKSTVITVARTIQRRLSYPELYGEEPTTGIFSYSRAISKAFLRNIKTLCEESLVLKLCYPDVVHNNPTSDAAKWSEEMGLWFKRSTNKKEACIEAWGLIEGMPTSKHFDFLLYDDITTMDTARTPEMTNKVKESFRMSMNLGSYTKHVTIVGTIYHHSDLLADILEDYRTHDRLKFSVSVQAGVEGGKWDGKSLFKPQEELDDLKNYPNEYATQILCDPTPQGIRVLNSNLIKIIEPHELPRDLYKFMIIDPAGTGGAARAKSGLHATGEIKAGTYTEGDNWAIVVMGMQPFKDANTGGSNVYLLDACVAPLGLDLAVRVIAEMYLRNPGILKLGVENTGTNFLDSHVKKALVDYGIHLSIEGGTMQVLRPQARKKEFRIRAALEYPINTGSFHICTSVQADMIQHILLEFEKFPSWKDDGIDAISYLYDITKDYIFPNIQDTLLQARFRELGIDLLNEDENMTKDGWYYV